MKTLFLLLVLFSFGCTQNQVATAPPVPPAKPKLALLSQRVERTDETMVGVHGEVKNNGSVPAERVVLTVTGYDKQGQIIRSDQGMLNPDPVEPGQTAIFAIYLLDAPGFHSHKVTATIGGESIALDTQRR